MPTILERPSEQGLHLVRVVANGYTLASGAWPNWQWVRHQLWREGLDAEDILQGLPTWEYGYRALRVGAHGQIPKVGDPVPLTIYGMANTVVPATANLAKAFLTALNVAAVMEKGINPPPTDVIELELGGEDLTRTVNQQAGTQFTVDQLF